MNEQQTFKVKVTYAKFFEVKANDTTTAMNKAINYYYSLNNFFNECTADIIEEDDDDCNHKYQILNY